MRARGIGYDIGFNVAGTPPRPFDHAVVRRELQIIRDDLHCTAVRLIGNDLDRLESAARDAASSPGPSDRSDRVPSPLRRGARPDIRWATHCITKKSLCCRNDPWFKSG